MQVRADHSLSPSAPEQLSGRDGLVLQYRTLMESAGGFLLQGAERLGAHVGRRGVS